MTTPGPQSLPKAGDRLLGKFRVERVVGQGGAGIVFAAHHELLDQPIAIKLMLADSGSEAATRFVNEAKLAAKIHSEHVCRVMDVGTLENGLPFIAMEYLEGQDLDAVIEVGPVPLARACDYVMQALEAIAQAHTQGIVHRDLKPSNLFLAKVPARDMPIVKVLDFGISKGDMLGGDTDVTSSRAILGSPSYMSPEQIKNARTVDARTDIWSIGVILYELTTGQSPFGGETVGEVFAKILEGEPRPLRDHAPHLPEGFQEVVSRCLRRDREQRYPDVTALADALAPFAAESSPELLKSIHGAVSPLLAGRVPSSNRGEAKPTRHDSPASERAVRGARPRPSSNSEAAASATAAPWIEAPPAKPKRGRARWLLAFVAFAAGGTSVWYLGRAPNLASNIEAMASAAVDKGAFGEAGEPLDASADAEGSSVATGQGVSTPPPTFGVDADAARELGEIHTTGDAAFIDGGATDADASSDGGDDAAAEEDDEEDEPAAAADGGASVTASKSSALRPKAATKSTPKKKSPTKRKKTRK